MKLRLFLRCLFVIVAPCLLGLPAPPASAQASLRLADFQEKVDDAAEALAGNPRFKGLSAERRRQIVEFVSGNMMFVLLHELGHAAISEMNLPVLGKEEDAADAFASTRLIRMGSDVTNRVVIEAAKGWFMADRRDQAEGEMIPYYDEHGLNQVRAYQIVCFLVGSDKQKFKDLSTETKLPEGRQDSCAQDYKRALNSWNAVLQPHLRAIEDPQTKIEVTYGNAEGRLGVAAQVFRSVKLLELVAQRSAELIKWPEPFALEMQSCGFINARWDRTNRKLTLCYELAADFADLYRDYGDVLAENTKDAVSKPAVPRSSYRSGRATRRQESRLAQRSGEPRTRGRAGVSLPPTIEIGGRRYLWRDILALRRRQAAGHGRA